MSDYNSLFLQTASSVMSELDIHYREANLDGKVQLKEELDRTTMTFSEVRCKLLENEVLCTPEDILKMQALRQEIEGAEEIQTVLNVAARLTRILARL